jgi:hypothetical protein
MIRYVPYLRYRINFDTLYEIHFDIIIGDGLKNIKEMV